MNNKAKKTTQRKILVVEDEGDMCLLLELLLNGKETVVDHVKSLAGAAAYLRSEQPSLILLDNRLPDGYGLNFIGFLRDHYPQIKIIMISGFDVAAQDIALEAGADNFLKKPFTREQLHESIMNVLN